MEMVKVNKNYGRHIDFPEDWGIVSIKEMFDFFSTATYSRADLNDIDITSYVHYGDIHTKFNFHLDLDKVDLPRVSADKVKKYELLKEGDIIIADASEDYEGVGKAVEIINVNSKRAISGLHTFLLRDNGNYFTPKFKGYTLLSSFVREQFYRFATGTKVYSVSKDVLGAIKIPLPCLSEQKAIADCFLIWDKATESQINLIKAKENRKKALVQQLFSGKKRLPGFNDKWRDVKFGDIFSERNETKLEHLQLLSIGQDGIYPQTDSNKRDISNSDKSKYKRIAPGDIGYNTMRMWQGRSALSQLEGVVSPAYTVLVPNKDVNSYYFSILFKMSKLTNLFWRNSQGLVDDTLNCKYKDFSIIKCKVPSFEEQNAIAKVIEIVDKEIQLERMKLDDLQQQKKALMQQLLTGKVRLVF